jgi:hypothetical protein
MFSPADSLLLRLDRRRNTQWGSGEMSMAPQPKGMSDCGIWYAPDCFLENLENISPLLSSIFIEYYPRYRTIVATKFDVIVPMLKGLCAADAM